MSKIPKKLRHDFLRLLLHLKCGSPIGEPSRLRLITFIRENLPTQKETSSDSDKLDHYCLVDEAIKRGYKTGNNSQSDSAFYTAANSSGNPVGEATVKKHYYEVKKYLEGSDDVYASAMNSAQSMPAPPDDCVGPVIYLEARCGDNKTKRENQIITYSGVFVYNSDTQSTEKIRDANESDLALLSRISSRMHSEGMD